MKKTIMLFLAVSALENVEAQKNGRELIINGNFANNDCSEDWCIFNTPISVRGWTPKPEIQIGFGKIYNSRLGNQRVIELAPNENTCIEQNVRNLVPGVYQLKYSYAARQGISFGNCQFKVEFNDRELRHITPDDYNINTDIIEFQVKDGCDGRIKFCGASEQNNFFGAIIKTVSLIRKKLYSTVAEPSLLQPSVIGMSAIDTVFSGSLPRFGHEEKNRNFLINGNFKENLCRFKWCIFYYGTLNTVTGWVPEPQIQIGFGTVYNKKLGVDRVVELGPNTNSCIRQEVKNLKRGFYRLEVVYAARQGRDLSDCQFLIEFNGKVLRKIQPTDYQVRLTTILFNFTSQTQGELRLCGIGGIDNNSFGALIKEVKLTRPDEFNHELLQETRRGFGRGYENGVGQVFGQEFNPSIQGNQLLNSQVLNPAFGSSVNQLGNLGNNNQGLRDQFGLNKQLEGPLSGLGFGNNLQGLQYQTGPNRL